MRDLDAEYDVAIDHMLELGFDPNELAIVLDEAGDIERRALALREGETLKRVFRVYVVKLGNDLRWFPVWICPEFMPNSLKHPKVAHAQMA